MAIDYQEMLDEIIQLIKDDDTANSETIAGMVERLQELNALGQAQFLARNINTGTGLVGGGDLSEDRTLSLSQAALDALAAANESVSTEGLVDTLADYLSKAEASDGYATKADARQVAYLPFNHPGLLNGEVTSPGIRLPVDGEITHVSIAVTGAGQAVSATLQGGAVGSVSLPAGQTSVTGAVDSPVSGPVRVHVESGSAQDVVVTLRVREV